VRSAERLPFDVCGRGVGRKSILCKLTVRNWCVGSVVI